MSRRRWVATLAGLMLLTGCTTIPSSSSPQVVRTLNRGGSSSPQASITPEPGEEPREVVNKFITAAVQAGALHSSSRQFLTATAARKWQDNTTVILADAAPGVSRYDSADRATVVVKSRRIGQLDALGVYTPTLKNLGQGDPETFTYRLVKTSGQWRIDQPPPGVVVDQGAFKASFPASALYFLNSVETDSSQISLVPDLRYTALTGQSLASWLLAQLLAGPRPELAQSVASEVPDQVGKATVQLGDPIQVEIPGTSQLDGVGRNALAAQLAYTFLTFEYGGAQLTITDGGRPVRIPAAGGTTFSQSDFNVPSLAPPATSAKAYYLRGGAVIDATNDKPLPGLLGQPNQLDSVALRDDGSGVLQAAGVRQDSLLVGTDKQLVKVPLPPGELSRPEWRPHATPADVWVGVGDKGAIYRVTPGQSGPAKAVSITSPVGGSLAGQVLALRFSPDGARVAAAVRAPDGTSAAWVGSVVSSGTDLRIDAFGPVTPTQLVVTDVAWADGKTLSVIGAATGPSAANGGVAQMWQLGSDGSRLTPISNFGLPPPGPPTAIAARDGQPTLVSASGAIWARASPESQQWQSYPATKNSSQGINPIFAE
jgi:hypothetical protein